MLIEMKIKLKEGLYIDKKGMLFYINVFQAKCIGEKYLSHQLNKN